MKKRFIRLLVMNIGFVAALMLSGCSAKKQNPESVAGTEEMTTEEGTELQTTETEEVSGIENYGQQDGLKYVVKDGEITILQYLETVQEAAIDIPEELDGMKVVAIGDNAFQKTQVAYVTLPETITSIGKEAFQGCLKLQRINIPDSVTSIGEDAFRIMTNTEGKYNLIECNRDSYGWQYAVDNQLVYVTPGAEPSENENSLLACYTHQGENSIFEIYEYQDDVGESVEWRIDICALDTKEIRQSITILPEESGDPHINTMLEEEDVNFDGSKELIISKGHFGNSGVLYDACYVANSENGLYEECISYGEIPNPEALSATKTIRGFIDESNNLYHYYMYEYQDGQYVRVATLSFEGTANGVQITEERVVDGKVIVSDSVSTDFNTALQEWGNDGYWNLAVNG